MPLFLAPNIPPDFGTSEDGVVSIGVDTTLTRVMQYTFVTVDAGFTLNPGGFTGPLASNLIVANGIISRVGGNAIADVGGVNSPVSYLGRGNGGGDGKPGAGGVGTAAVSAPHSNNGGAGGGGSVGPGGAGGVATQILETIGNYQAIYNAHNGRFASATSLTVPTGGAGGGGGGGDGALPGGGGGAGGNRMHVAGLNIVVGAAGAIHCDGGNGAAGPTNNTGGGGGGSGGFLGVTARNYSGLLPRAAGGLGGAGGGGGGLAGTAGGVGVAIRLPA